MGNYEDIYDINKKMNKSDYNKRYTLEEVKSIFIDYGYIPLFDEYKTNQHKLLCQSVELGYKGFIRLNSLLTGQAIAWFHHANPYTINNIKVFILKNDILCELLTDTWVSSRTELKFRCKLCNGEFRMSWASFKRREAKCCTNCINKHNIDKRRNSLKFIKNEFIKSGLIPLFDDYTNNKEKLLAQDRDGYLGLISYHQLSGETVFDKFHPKNPYTYKNIENYMKIHNISCEYISGKYKRNTSLLTFQCECGEFFTASWVTFSNLHKHRCDKCTKVKSKLELLTEEWLSNNNIAFKSQYSFDDCRNVKPLRFDFCIKDGNKVILVECQGIQHYESIEFFGGEEALEYRKRNDDIKRDYCVSKGFKLVEISYRAFDTNKYKDILRKEIIS